MPPTRRTRTRVSRWAITFSTLRASKRRVSSTQPSAVWPNSRSSGSTPSTPTKYQWICIGKIKNGHGLIRSFAFSSNLFSEGKTWGHDLVAITVQRGRDHGVPSYNEYRQLCGLPKAESFIDFSGLMDDFVSSVDIALKWSICLERTSRIHHSISGRNLLINIPILERWKFPVSWLPLVQNLRACQVPFKHFLSREN